MRTLLAFLVSLAVLSVGHGQSVPTSKKGEPQQKPEVWKEVERFQYDWQGTGKKATFILEKSSAAKAPGAFTRLRIQPHSRREFILENLDGWVSYAYEEPSGTYEHESWESDHPKALNRMNVSPSKYLLFVPFHRGKPPLLFVFGFPYGGYLPTLHVLGVGRDGQPHVLLQESEFLMMDYKDFDGDGYPEIAGQPCLAEALSEQESTYAPLNVYQIPHNEAGQALVSVKLSKPYTLGKKRAWAGPKCSQKLMVIERPGKRPVVKPLTDR